MNHFPELLTYAPYNWTGGNRQICTHSANTVWVGKDDGNCGELLLLCTPMESKDAPSRCMSGTDWEHETCPAMQQTSLCCNLVCYWNLRDGLGQRPWNRPVRPPLHWIEAAVIKYTQLELWLNAIHFSPGVPFLYCPAQTTQTGNVKISHKELKHTVASSADCQVQPALTSPVMLAQGHFGLN